VKALASIIAANTLVLGLWRVSPALNQWMWRNFACSYNAVTHGRRVHTLLTSAFSHITLPHFAINMFMLWEFGRQVLAPSTSVNNQQDRWYSRAVANSRVAGYFSNPFGETAQLLSLEKFLALYFGSAFASSALSVVVSRLRGSPGGAWVALSTKRRIDFSDAGLHFMCCCRTSVFTIGASGAVMGIFTVYCLTFPQREVRFCLGRAASHGQPLTHTRRCLNSSCFTGLSISQRPRCCS
jgi:membrane associated rhomboid family serine protease